LALSLSFVGPSGGRLSAAASSSQRTPIAQLDAEGPGQKFPEVKEALARFNEGNFDGALALLAEAVKQHPELPPARVIMAQLFSAAKQPAAVRSSLEQAVVEAPADPRAYLLLAELALRERRWTEADLLYTKATQTASAFEGSADRKRALRQRGYVGLASVAEARRDWESAQKHLEALLAIDPKSSATLQRLGVALFHQGKTPEALEKLEAAAKIDPAILTPEATIARLYEQAGDRENASKYMAEAWKANPENLETRLAAAQWALGAEQLDLAAEEAKAASPCKEIARPYLCHNR
jgi:tetratricopeptide (TPR) repeat protein